MRYVHCLASALLLSLVLTATTSGQSYSIAKFAIAGGGGLKSAGGAYSMSGTIGQHEASGPLIGGTFTLVVGFWALPVTVQTPDAPLLSVEQLAGHNVRVYWPLPATGFVLDQATSLVSPPATNTWTQVAFPYQTNATQISITVPSAANKFYRLRKP